MAQKRLKLGIIISPKGQAATAPLSDLVSILNGLSNELHVIIAGSVRVLHKNELKSIHIHNICYKTHSNIIAKVINHIYVQLIFSYIIIKLSRKVDVWFFFLEGHALLLPVLTTKLLRKTEIFILAASIKKAAKVNKSIFDKMVIFSENIGFQISNRIILYSENLIHEWGLEKHKSKISIAHQHFIDSTHLTPKNNIDDNGEVVGFIGRFSKEKGILNLVQAIPHVLRKRKNIHFILCGDGEMFEEIRNIIQNKGLEAHVKMTGWISFNDVPRYLKELKLLVIPSYTEGLPNIMLEAMACGTPVLATPVGAIPDIINDGGTGFIMENNSPECIAENIIKALNNPGLEKIAENARLMVWNDFTFEKESASFRVVFKKL